MSFIGPITKHRLITSSITTFFKVEGEYLLAARAFQILIAHWANGFCPVLLSKD
jgi:hypothetical protein